jgi:N-acetylneuraminate synthase/UDP-hydrolysing UDP-N-acetyl-D-glucosamine 2-epimerase
VAARRICVLTTTRAEYGLLLPLLREILAREELELQLVVSGTHLSPEFGMTVDGIEADGIPIAARVDILAPGDDIKAAARTMAAATEKLSTAFEELNPDLLVLLGDRYETLAAASVATLARLPIAHIHGGELTEGAFDDAIRHAITKLSHLHFASAEPYRQRIIQLGENPDTVFCVGALGIDVINAMDLVPREDLATDLKLDLQAPVLLVTFHPTTLADDPTAGAAALTAALSRFPEATIVFTGINADPGHESVAAEIRSFAARHPSRVSEHASLGNRRYLSLMKIANVVVGNSSSGVIEAPVLGTPTVNIGDRQSGRLRAASVFDCAETPDAIEAAIRRALAFTASDSPQENLLLGDGGVSRRIADTIATVDLERVLRKRFHNRPAAILPGARVVVIAEAGVNHNGDVTTAKALVDAAVAAGADAIKFQSFKSDAIATAAAPKAAYQAQRTGANETQLDMLRTLELDESEQRAVFEYCREKGIRFLSTPFDHGSLSFLVDSLGLPQLKIGSGDLTNAPLLLAAAQRNCNVILSTGMATTSEIALALAVLAFGYIGGRDVPNRRAFEVAYASAAGRAALQSRVTLLHCTTAYPTPPGDINLRAMDALSAQFGLTVGFSDHSQGPAAAIAAVARGAAVVEKHLTLDRTMKGPDHAASMEPAAFAEMVVSIRDIEQALGDGVKRPRPIELENKHMARKSLVAARPIAKGEHFTSDNVTVKRPETGVSALDYFDWLGRKAARAYATDDVIS